MLTACAREVKEIRLPNPVRETKPSAEFVGGGGEVEILLRDAAGVVGDEGDAHLVVADIDVGVVAGIFGEVADLIDEGQRGSEVLEEEGAHELAGIDLPVGNGDKTRFDFGFG